jgi:hypothetical protein
MFNFPSGKPVTHKPSNKYQYNRKTSQAIAIYQAQHPPRIISIIDQQDEWTLLQLNFNYPAIPFSC